jgi:dUTP pyrophosphatase
MKVKIKTNFVNKSMKVPSYAHEQDAGMDLQANLDKPYLLHSLDTKLVPTGLSVALPITVDRAYTWELQIRPRSGLALRGITVLNAPGTIDAGYRGEIKVILHNASGDALHIEPGMRIAQMVLSKAYRIEWQEVHSLDETSRGAGGFGSTGH